ncbi:unnamed protein product [Ectocarpus sp. 4 AP-2014]
MGCSRTGMTRTRRRMRTAQPCRRARDTIPTWSSTAFFGRTSRTCRTFTTTSRGPTVRCWERTW